IGPAPQPDRLDWRIPDPGGAIDPLHQRRSAQMAQDVARATRWSPAQWRAAREQAEVAKVLCRTCPSREPCLAFALATGQALGVWGGTSPEDRRIILGGGRRTQMAS